MKISKALITAAAPSQRALPLQTLVDREGTPRSVLAIIIDEARRAGIEEIAVVVHPGDAGAYQAAVHGEGITFLEQPEPRGYGDAVLRAKPFVGDSPFLHLVGDHVYVSPGATGTARLLVEAAEANSCAVSAVQPTRETLLPYFGAVGGRRVPGTERLYAVERVAEKPTPTLAEQNLIIPGLRAGHYLCFYGMHVLTPSLFAVLEEDAARSGGVFGLSQALDRLARREQYLALEVDGQRYPVDGRYGLWIAQTALALGGRDRDEALTALCELLAQRRLITQEAGA